MEDVAQNADGLGNQIVSQDSIECSIGPGSCGKEAIRYGLGIEVSKLFRLKVENEMSLECLIKTKNLLCACAGCFTKFLFDNLISQEARACGEISCKTLSTELRR